MPWKGGGTLTDTALQQLWLALAAVALLLLVFGLIRSGRLAIRFGVAWTLAPIVLIAVSPALMFVPGLAGIVGLTPTGLLLGLAGSALVAVCLQLSATLSRAQADIRELAETIALLESRVVESGNLAKEPGDDT